MGRRDVVGLQQSVSQTHELVDPAGHLWKKENRGLKGPVPGRKDRTGYDFLKGRHQKQKHNSKSNRWMNGKSAHVAVRTMGGHRGPRNNMPGVCGKASQAKREGAATIVAPLP